MREIKSSLRERGIRVKKKDLLNFFCYLEEKCPWLIVHGPDIHPLTWKKVGKEINDHLRNGKEVPKSFFSFYGIIRDILKDSGKEGQASHLLALYEDFISGRQESESATLLGEVAPSFSPRREGPGSSASSLVDERVGDRQLHPPLIDKPSAPPIFPPPALYPVIPEDRNNDWLDSGDEIDLEGETVTYERGRHNASIVAPTRTQEGRGTSQRPRWSQPPPYVPLHNCQIQSALPPQTPGVDSLLATKRSLASQITQLRGVISLQKELKDLTTQIQTLQVDLLTPSLPPSTSQESPDKPPQTRAAKARPPKTRSAPIKHRLTFPVMTRSRGTAPDTQAESSTSDIEDGQDGEESQSEGEEEARKTFQQVVLALLRPSN